MSYDGNSTALGRGTATPAQIEAIMDARGKTLAPSYAPDRTYRPAPAGIGQMICDAAMYWEDTGHVVNQDILTSDIIKECAAWQSAIARDKNNPSGLGAENDDPYRKADAFHHAWYGILATVAHFLHYFVGEGPWTEHDPRTPEMREHGYMGIAKKLSDLDGRWAWPGDGYGASVADGANAVAAFGTKAKVMPNPIIQRDEIEGVPFRVSIIPLDNRNRTNRPMSSVKPPVVHDTGNINVGANAEMHRRFAHNGGGREGVSWHFTVDEEEIIQTLPLYERGIHAGNADCNATRAGIELCVNSDGDFNKTMANGAKLVRFLAGYDAAMDGMVQHFNCSGKNCPAKLRAGRWEEFVALVNAREPEVTPPDPNAKVFEYDGNEFWIVNDETEDGHQVDMLDFYREMGGLPRLGLPREGMRRRDENDPPVYVQRCENVLLECWIEGFGNMPGPYYRFGLIP